MVEPNGFVGTLQYCIQKQYVVQDTLKWFIYNFVLPAAHVLIADRGIPYKIWIGGRNYTMI